ncbi:MAG: hypothetical protein KGL48_10000 [Sphingomonadales bacterium]|nr:hypothetical protein [Sphingomonadales bacterium]MDE2570238.1 hypothetical protein [Sphingomonadales bacterium]
MRLPILVLLLAFAIDGPACARDVQVPFVGCRSDGQAGALAAPKDGGHAPRLAEQLALHLSWYASNNTGGVLAPRGWQCFELYGSNGSVLMVAPNGLDQDPFEAKLLGPAIQLSTSLGATSGRFEAARIAARLFPDRKRFVDSVIDEEIVPRSNFIFGTFSHDRIHRLNRDYVEFETPARMDGIGTMTRLRKSGNPIHGLVWMDDDNNATILAVRLTPGQKDLADYIVATMKPR